ncbi:MAG: hypothetical protein ABIR60_06085 [Allosphingosinicella sp.]
MARFAWAEPLRAPSPAEALDLASGLEEGLPRAPLAAIEECAQALRALMRSRDWPELSRFDRSAARLNSGLTGSELVFVRCDPCAEIVRLQLHLEATCWPVEPETAAAMSRVLDAAASLPVAATAARVRHGNLALRHVMTCRGRTVLCDLEGVRFAFGNLDVAGLVLDSLGGRGGDGPGAEDAVRLIWSVEADLHERHAALLWVVAEAFHTALGRASWGRPKALDSAAAYCERLLAAAGAFKRR